jgi:hypothetical protein
MGDMGTDGDVDNILKRIEVLGSQDGLNLPTVE